MKRTYIAAAALLLGTSAFAWAPSSAPVAHDAKDPVAVGDVDKSKDAGSGWWTQDSQMQPAAFESWGDQPEPGAGDPDLDLSESPAAPESDTDELAEPDAEATETGMTDAATGMGGPDDSAEETTVAAADLAPRPAAQNYPPCAPGPGDDNCIQLYEPGVRVALASWSQPTGGLLGDQATTAMGGPYEPVAAEGEVAMNGDGDVDAAAGETAETELASAEQFTGVGGPIAETGYPPCSPGPGDDRCIQLYEPGVTGAGN